MKVLRRPTILMLVGGSGAVARLRSGFCLAVVALTACAVAGAGSADADEEPNWDLARKGADSMRNAYCNATWEIRDRINGKTYRAVFAYPNLKIENLDEHGSVVRADVIGPELHFALSPGRSAETFTLQTVEPRPTNLFFVAPRAPTNGIAPTPTNAAAAGDATRGAPLVSPWMSALRQLDIVDAVRGRPGKRIAGPWPADSPFRFEWKLRDGVKVCRISLSDPAGMLSIATDFRPDLGWAVDQEEDVVPAPPDRDTARRLYSLPQEQRAAECRKFPKRVSTYHVRYEGEINGIPAVKEFTKNVSLRERSEAPQTVSSLEVLSVKSGSRPVEEFLPEHYGVAYSRPPTFPWRWVAGIVGALGFVAGLWWLRRRAAAS